MTPAVLLRSAAERFRRAGIPDPETDSSLLLSHICGLHPLSLRLDTETELDTETLDTYAELAERRVKREPLQYITGEAPFFGRIFHVDNRVLIPRPETELLCEWLLQLIPASSDVYLLDLCCGSGCIGLTILLERPFLHVTLSDISSDALSVAQLNAKHFGISAEFQCCDLTADFSDHSFDYIITNPPYIPSSDCPNLQKEVLCEPLSALDGGKDGLDFYRRIAEDAPRILKPGGRLLMELGFNESSEVSELLDAYGYTDIVVRKDLNGLDRMIMATSALWRAYV